MLQFSPSQSMRLKLLGFARDCVPNTPVEKLGGHWTTEEATVVSTTRSMLQVIKKLRADRVWGSFNTEGTHPANSRQIKQDYRIPFKGDHSPFTRHTVPNHGCQSKREKVNTGQGPSPDSRVCDWHEGYGNKMNHQLWTHLWYTSSTCPHTYCSNSHDQEQVR
jgi:hypothetical protein